MDNFLTYGIGKISVILPEEHLLDVYQGTHPLYNLFQGFLVRSLSPNATIVEVGANVGDIMANIFQHNRTLDYIGVEGDPIFFEYLLINADILKKELLIQDNQINLVKSFVAGELSFSAFTGSGGTRSGILSSSKNESIQTRKLDEILSDLKVRKIDLLMVDVDGYDYDIIDSSMNTISRDKPLIFFEMTVGTEHQMEKYFRMIRNLKLLGYERISVLDNFGNLIFKNCTLDSLRELSNYAFRQNLGIGSRTIYYLDVLISHRNDSEMHSLIVSEYAIDPTQSF
jgi:FkbM family methyltransferase